MHEFPGLSDGAGFLPCCRSDTFAELHGWVHVVADVAIWVAFMGIPIGIVLLMRRRPGLPFARVLWLFALSIGTCGIGHLLEAGMFWWPAHRLAGAVEVATAVAALAALVAFVSFFSRAIRLPALPDLMASLARSRSEQASMQRQLHLTQQQLRTAVMASRVCLWRWGPKDDVVELDDSTAAMFGLSPADRPCSLFDLAARVHAHDRAAFVELLRACAHKGGFVQHVFRLEAASGIVHVESRMHGAGDGVSGAFLDVTARERSQALFRACVESAPSAVLMVDPNGRILLANPAAGTLFGCPAEQLLARSVDDLVPDRVRPRHPALRERFFAAPSQRQLGIGHDLTARRGDGRLVPVEIGLAPVRVDDGDAVLVTLVDVTARRQAEQQLREQQRELAEHVRTLEEFAHVVSHDLKAPLRGIRHLAEWLREDHGAAVGEGGLERIDRIVERASRMNTLIEDLLERAAGGRGAGLVEPVSAGDAARAIVELLAPPPGIEVAIGPLPDVAYDRVHLERVLQNLIGNAIQHMGRQHGRIAVTARDGDDEWVFSVADDGNGMAGRDDAGAAHRRGIGLSIVRGIVERYGGRLWLEAADPGTNASFTVPKAPGSARRGPPAERAGGRG